MKKTTEKAMMLMLVILTAMAVLLPAGAASVYTPQAPGTTEFDHGLTLTKAPYQLGGEITFTFTVEGGAQVTSPTGYETTDLVSGAGPKLGEVKYGPTDNFATPADHTVTKTLTVDWQDTKFNEPGIYYWKINKTVAKDTALTEEVSNQHPTTYLFVYVYDNGQGALTVGNVGLHTGTDSGSYTDVKLAEIVDNYPATPQQLKVTKHVAGNMGSRDQYFKFTIELTLPTGLAETDYAITGFDEASVVNAGPYNKSSSAVQPTNPVKLKGGANTIEVWLKHGQTVTIADLPNPTTYKVTETAASGYTKTTVSNNGTEASGQVAEGTLTTFEIDISYTNERQETPPTGVFTDNSAAVAGLLAGAGLILVLALSRRKRRVH